jgi:hypothetical protein
MHELRNKGRNKFSFWPPAEGLQMEMEHYRMMCWKKQKAILSDDSIILNDEVSIRQKAPLARNIFRAMSPVLDDLIQPEYKKFRVKSFQISI